VEPYDKVVGNPAKSIGHRFPKHLVNQLLELKWWDFSVEKIEKLVPYMMDTNIELFLEKAKCV
jgi:virginiamycin A acetyltransferase